MGRPALMWHRQARIKATAVDIASSVAEAIVQRTNLLRTCLEEEGIAHAKPQRFVSGEGPIECTLFEWFLHDAVIILEFGWRGPSARRSPAVS